MSAAVPAKVLVVDAGNTRSKFALMEAASLGEQRLPTCRAFAAVPRGDSPPWSEIKNWLTMGESMGEAAGETASVGIVTGSNPTEIERIVSDWPFDDGPPRVLTNRSELPLSIDVDEPDRVGMDRLLNAVAANATRRSEQPMIVIDVGTATTIDVVDETGTFIGGVILAGPELSARALHEYTAVLPYVPLDELAERVPPVIGRNTEDAIRSGLYWGHWHSVWNYCVRMMEPLSSSVPPRVILTGGAAHLYSDRLPPPHRYEPHLTLQGLAVATMTSPGGGE